MAIKKIGLLAIAGLSLAVSAQSFAGTNGSWTGLYTGVQAGYGWGENHIVDEELPTPGTSDWNIKYDLDGATGGIFGGYNYQNGMWVYGVEFDAELADVKGNAPPPGWFDSVTAKISSQVSARGRVGYVYNRALIYATGGIAFANIKTEYSNSSGIDGFSQTRSGWTLGAGVDYGFAPNWMARLEYRYADFGSLTNHTVTTDSGWIYHNDITEQTIRAGVAYQF